MKQATHYTDRDAFLLDAVPGSFWVSDGPEHVNFWFFCPCGCGEKRVIRVGRGYKPDAGPSWHWNGATEKPTLKPSVDLGHWHGWLTGGIWQK
ncbi:DUF6527 family protein [Salipiger thiooxidans]|uniref:DUF6527 family protein n=1 Tax=Salipiger thiooxidans TaxID=282683 RepID=UPI001CD57D6F|nr:DUF6527 family protein [Salipiger thiooxidans]MCA0851488.1 hypothetical protein [Salipiger thiooxidans]